MANISIPTSIAGISLPGKLGAIASGPLAALFGGSGSGTPLKYPLNLATDATKNHYVQFVIKEIVPANYASKSGAGTIPGTSIGLPNLGGAISSVAAKATDATDGIPVVGGIAAATGAVASAIGSVVSKGLTISPQTTKPKAYISLYMPDTMNANYDASYDELSLTNDLGGLITSLRMIDQLSPKAGAAAKDAFSGGDIMGGISKLGASAGSIASTDPSAMYLLNQAGQTAGVTNEALQSVLLKGQGYAINPQLQMIYRGMGFRSFQLMFLFSPKSHQEADQINSIIHTFKYHHAPTLQAGAADSTQSMFLVPPSIFNIRFYLGSDENIYVPRYGDCVLQSIDVNYTPNGWASYEDGFPVQTQLTLQFKETEVIDRNKLQNGFQNKSQGLR